MITSMCAGWGIEKDGITDYSGYLAGEIRSKGIDVRAVQLGHYIGPRRYYAEAARRAAEADICHVQFNYVYFNGELPYRNRFLYFAGRVGIPLVMTAHEVRITSGPLTAGFSSSINMAAYNALLPVLNRWSLAFHARMYARADRIIVHTQEHANAIRALIKGTDKVVLIPHGIPEIPDSDRNISAVDAKRRLGLNGKKVLTIPGFITGRKGYEAALEALSGLPEDVILLVAGGAMTKSAADVECYEALEKMISARRIGERVKITGYLEKKDIPDVMAATDICLAPFSSTAASGALSLCIGYHKPVIASDVSVHMDINSRIACLELFKNGDREDLLRKIRMVLNDESRLKTLSNAAAAYARRYSYAKAAQATISVYEDVLQKKAALTRQA